MLALAGKRGQLWSLWLAVLPGQSFRKRLPGASGAKLADNGGGWQYKVLDDGITGG